MKRPGLTLILLVGSILFPLCARGSLGMSEASVKRNVESANATAKVQTTANYKVYKYTIPEPYAVITECVSAAGNVFAISWSDATKRPDLSQLLGPYFSDFDANDPARNKQAGRSMHVVKTSDLEVRAGGHMRALHGKAIVQKFVPTPGAEVECLK